MHDVYLYVIFVFYSNVNITLSGQLCEIAPFANQFYPE